MRKIVLSSFVAFILSSCSTALTPNTGSSRPDYNGESSIPNYHSDRKHHKNKHHRKGHSNSSVGGSGSYNGGGSGGSSNFIYT